MADEILEITVAVKIYPNRTVSLSSFIIQSPFLRLNILKCTGITLTVFILELNTLSRTNANHEL